jgi:hypothetical protein
LQEYPLHLFLHFAGYALRSSVLAGPNPPCRTINANRDFIAARLGDAKAFIDAIAEADSLILANPNTWKSNSLYGRWDDRERPASPLLTSRATDTSAHCFLLFTHDFCHLYPFPASKTAENTAY